MALSTTGGDGGLTPAPDALRIAAETMHAVRDRCVWTQRMTHAALVPYLVEESAELIDAVEAGTREDLREELGDLLWQVLFHAEIASRDDVDPFDIDDVARTLTEKMVRRHPHVFGDAVATTPEEVLVHWNAAKAAEKRRRTSVLDGVSPHMPSLALAQKVLSRSSRLRTPAASGPSVPSVPSSVPSVPSVRSARQHPGTETAATDRSLGAPMQSRGDGHGDGHGDGGGAPMTEAALGQALLDLVDLARERGWDAERALRGRLRTLETEIRDAETRDAETGDAGGRAAAPADANLEQ